MAKCRNCNTILHCDTVFGLKLKCPKCGYEYNAPWYLKSCDELIERYMEEPWNKKELV